MELNSANSVGDEDDNPLSKDNMSFFCCDDPILFQMRDRYHEFSLGLFTILDCLKIAEQKGHVPKLPDEWWLSNKIRYDR